MAGKIITISSVKGGVGKTTMTLNLAGIYCELNKRVLIIDLDLYSGGIAASLNVKNKKDIGITMTSTNQSFVKDNFFKGNYIDIKDGKIYMYNFKENKSKIIELFKL